MPAPVKKNVRRQAKKSPAPAPRFDDCRLPVPASEARRQGAATIYPPQVFDKRVNPANPLWAGYRPRWLFEAEKAVRIGPESFRYFRAHVHCMTVAQCAAFLRVDMASIGKWEAGLEPIPYAAYATLRLADELQFLPHEIKEWADFEIIAAGPDRGKLLDHRTGEMFSRDEITTIRYVYADACRVLRENQSLKRQVARLEERVVSLRDLRQVDSVALELQHMQERLRVLAQGIYQGVPLDINQGTIARQLQEIPS